ncbi:MAG TPA: hypothetical protein DCS63_07730 [Elusimicrobia bacterium]|nr:hypothetical protein [Elusimicrobiota bacterium]
MVRASAFALAAVFFCACSGSRVGTTNGSAVVFQKQTFKLLKTPDPEFEAAMEGLLSSSYEAAAKNHAGDRPMDIGFTYSMSPRGAVYPFSEIEVSCIIQERHAKSHGPELCGDLFRQLGVKVKRALSGR